MKISKKYVQSNYMNVKQSFMHQFRLPTFGFLFLLLSQQSLAQPSVSDSLLKSSLLYQKGKGNIQTGRVLLGIGAVSTLVGLAMSEWEPSSGFHFGPSDREVVLFLGGVFGFTGAMKLVQGSIRISKPRADVNAVSYWKAPGQESSMPALTLRWSMGSGRHKEVSR